MKAFAQRVLSGDATKDQARDTGMAIVLLSLLLWLWRDQDGFVTFAVCMLLVTMTVPQLLRPAAVLWLGLSQLTGAIGSRVVLTVVFFAVVTPIGLWRRLFGADPLHLRGFRAGTESVMSERNHTFVAKDLDNPY